MVYKNMAALSEQLVLQRSKARSLSDVRRLQCWGMNLNKVLLWDRQYGHVAVTCSLYCKGGGIEIPGQFGSS